MPNKRDDYDTPHYGEPRRHDYRTARDAGYRGGGYLGGGWAGGERYPYPYRGQSGPMWGPPDRDYFGTDEESYRGLGPKNYRRSDEHIREDICDLLTIDDGVDASDIEVSVNDRVVVLAGTVSDRRAKRRAEDIAEMVHGVREVQNNLRVAR